MIDCSVAFNALPASIVFKISSNNEPKKAEMIAGGASLAPKRWSLPGEAIAARKIAALS